jgi:hypothetical protein
MTYEKNQPWFFNNKESRLRVIKFIALILLIFGLAINNRSCVYANKWNIDYDSPEKYLEPGEQSKISSQETIDMIRARLGKSSGLEGLRDLYLWKKQEFDAFQGGGKLIGKTTINLLLDKRKLSGCSDDALVFSAVARYLGHPTIMVDTAGLEWAENFKLRLTTSYVGHVFVEVFIAPNWILVNPTSGEFIMEYDPSNPVIPITSGDEKSGYYAILKGKDMWDYGVREPDMLKKKLREFAISFEPNEVEMPSYNIERLISISTSTTLAEISTSSSTSEFDNTMNSSTKTSSNGRKNKSEEVLSTKSDFLNQFSLGYLVILGMVALIGVIIGVALMKKRSKI